MNRDTLLDLFRTSGAQLEGHFRPTSGLYSPGYLQCALVRFDVPFDALLEVSLPACEPDACPCARRECRS
jgi:orotate phosphoribosyltransferase